MTNQEILELMARFDASSLTSFKLHSKDADLEMGKGLPAAPAVAAAPAAAPAAPAAPAPAPAAPAAAPAPAEEGKCITAPVVGTFLHCVCARSAALCAGRRQGAEGPDRLPHGGNEDDERGQGSVRLRH